MIQLALSPSKIEKYRQHVQEEYNGTITKQSLIDSITNKVQWSKQANFGTAFHLVMEQGAEPFKQTDGTYKIFDNEMPMPVFCEYSEIQLADEFHKRYPSMNYETWLTPKIRVDNFEIILRMRIDGLLGNEIHENKTSKRSLDVHFYERSLQWKIYLLSTLAKCVQYNVFNYKEPTELAEGKTRRAGTRELREVSYQPFRFYPAGHEIEQEVHMNIRGLINFCENHNLMDYILLK